GAGRPFSDLRALEAERLRDLAADVGLDRARAPERAADRESQSALLAGEPQVVAGDPLGALAPSGARHARIDLPCAFDEVEGRGGAGGALHVHDPPIARVAGQVARRLRFRAIPPRPPS